MKALFKLFVFWAVTAAAVFAASTVPVGGMRLTIAAGTGTGRVITVFSLPLPVESSAGGQLVGRIASVTTSTITVTNAGWTAGQLSVAATPHFIRITSGSSTGRSLLISTTTANTSTTLTIDSSEGVDLTTLGIVTGASGDTYKIFAADTIGNVFPAPPTVLGGSSAAVADNIQFIAQGAWRTYYYSTTSNRWTLLTLGSPDATNVPIKPDAAIIFSRLGNTAITLSALGTVPSTDRRVSVANAGATFAGTWPVGLTLGTSNIQSIPGWRSSATVTNADTVQMINTGAWRTYYYDGTNWRKLTLGTPIANNDAVSAASGVIILRGAGSGTSVLYQPLPYTIP